MKAAVESPQVVYIYCTSNDRCATSQMMTLVVAKRYVTGNSVDADNIDVINGGVASATHTLSYDGDSDSSAVRPPTGTPRMRTLQLSRTLTATAMQSSGA
jgi:hypothetical protein